MNEEIVKINPKVREILNILAAGVKIAAVFAFPKAAPYLIKSLEKQRDEIDDSWKKYNLWRLRALFKRLREQKDIEMVEKNGKQIIKITEKGKRRILKYKLNDFDLKKPKRWDGKWRLIIYDIPKEQKVPQQFFRETLKRLKFLPLQKSVYLTPYPCKDEIEFLRQYYEIGEGVIILTVSGIEDEEIYRDYFGI